MCVHAERARRVGDDAHVVVETRRWLRRVERELEPLALTTSIVAVQRARIESIEDRLWIGEARARPTRAQLRASWRAMSLEAIDEITQWLEVHAAHSRARLEALSHAIARGLATLTRLHDDAADGDVAAQWRVILSTRYRPLILRAALGLYGEDRAHALARALRERDDATARNP